MKKIFFLLLASNMLMAKNPEIELGQKLFFDPILSYNKTQSCATCHNPEFGFVDNRKLEKNFYGAVSIGDDGKSLGNRNAPTASYAKFSPKFHFNQDDLAIGGQFLDGRASNLSNQAKEPPLSKTEMNMPNKELILQRIKDNAYYYKAFTDLYGDNIFADTDKFYNKLTEVIASFEATDFFSSFDSKYDRYLNGEYDLTPLEDLGRALFFSNNNTNCASCHMLKEYPESSRDTFSNYQYFNIGVPRNKQLNIKQDLGLYNHTKNNSDKGKFKTPTLRNVAITSPYMHNGVFTDLETVILFYDKYINNDNNINPETNKSWEEPEVLDNIAINELKKGKKLNQRKVEALVAFLQTLTDKKYEYLLSK